MTVNGTDEFLVNRAGTTYTQEQQTIMASLQNDDLLLVNRSGTTYTITGQEFVESVIDPLEITVNLAPGTGYTSVEISAIPVATGGKQPDGGYIFTYQWVTADDTAGTNKANIPGETGDTFTPDNPQVGKYLGCVVGTTDALGTTAEGESYIGPIQVLAQPPIIADVVVSEIFDGQNRFTDKEFPYVTTMGVDGEPDPTYEVKAKISGTTFDFDVISNVITDVEGGGVKTCETDEIQSVEVIDWTSTIEARNTNASGGISETDGLFDSDDITVGPAYKKNGQGEGTYIEVVFTDNQGPVIASEGGIGFLSNYEAGISSTYEGYVEFMGGSQSPLTISGGSLSTIVAPFTGSGVIKSIRITRISEAYGGGSTHSAKITQVWADGYQLLDDNTTVLDFIRRE